MTKDEIYHKENWEKLKEKATNSGSVLAMFEEILLLLKLNKNQIWDWTSSQFEKKKWTNCRRNCKFNATI